MVYYNVKNEGLIEDYIRSLENYPEMTDINCFEEKMKEYTDMLLKKKVFRTSKQDSTDPLWFNEDIRKNIKVRRWVE